MAWNLPPPFLENKRWQMKDFSRRFRNHLHSHCSDMVFVAFCLLVPYHLHATWPGGLERFYTWPFCCFKLPFKSRSSFWSLYGLPSRNGLPGTPWPIIKMARWQSPSNGRRSSVTSRLKFERILLVSWWLHLTYEDEHIFNYWPVL